MTKNTLIFLAALGLMTSCNGKNNKDKKSAAPQVAPQSKPAPAVEEAEVSEADAKLEKFIRKSDWCRNVLGPEFSAIAVGEGSQVRVQYIKRSRDEDTLVKDQAFDSKVVDGQLVLTSEVKAGDVTETKTTKINVDAIADELRDILAVSVDGDPLGTKTYYERCVVKDDFNLVEAEEAPVAAEDDAASDVAQAE